MRLAQTRPEASPLTKSQARNAVHAAVNRLELQCRRAIRNDRECRYHPHGTHPRGSQIHALGLTRHRWSDHRDKRCDEEDGCEDTSTVLGARLPGRRLRP